MNAVSNRQVICDTLITLGKKDRNIVVLTSDSRGSASLVKFSKELPDQFIEVGIAEQNIVGIAAGLATAGKRPFIASPACFLSTRSIEQIKLDVAYSQTNVILIGISGGISYGALGMSHHSLQDLAVMRAIPGISVILPADRFETKKVIETLATGGGPAYVRIGRNPVPDVYENDDFLYQVGEAITMKQGTDLTIIATGEMVRLALDSAKALDEEGISCRVLNMHTIKPLDEKAIIKAAQETGHIITIEEHSIHGGLGSAVAELVGQHTPVPLRLLGIPDEPPISGKSAEVFAYYGLTVENIQKLAVEMLKD